VVLLGWPDPRESWPEVAASETVVGSCEVVVAFAFVSAHCTDVVYAYGVMAMRMAVCSHVVSEVELALASFATTVAPVAAASAAPAAVVASTAAAAAMLGHFVLANMCLEFFGALIVQDVHLRCDVGIAKASHEH
jgi:hypothetical protein